jgi:hypothetical protein
MDLSVSSEKAVDEDGYERILGKLQAMMKSNRGARLDVALFKCDIQHREWGTL